MLQATTALRKIAALRKRIRAIRGGQGSAKTTSILILLINHASAVPDREIFIVSAELTKMRITVIKDFVKLMKVACIFNALRFLAGTLYRFPNGSFIRFIGLDKEDIGKGLRCHVVYFNEINKVDRETYRQISSRAEQVFMDYNPDAEFFVDEDVIPRDDCDFLQLTFEDNEMLSEVERNEILMYQELGYNSDGTIKNKYWANLWQVYGLGNIGNLQGVVFDNWGLIDEIPGGVERVCYALDWGFTNDQTGLIDMYKKGDDLYVDELIYQTGLTNPMIAKLMRELGVGEYDEVVADSAEPKSIAEINAEGFNLVPAHKGPDSVRVSINILQRYRIWVTKRSTNLQKELRAYIWKTDVNGKALGEPIDKNNHLIDPLRYGALNNLGNTFVMDFATSKR